MAMGAGHYVGSGCWTGNVALFGHNRGSGVDHFAELKDVKVGDIVTTDESRYANLRGAYGDQHFEYRLSYSMRWVITVLHSSPALRTSLSPPVRAGRRDPINKFWRNHMNSKKPRSREQRTKPGTAARQSLSVSLISQSEFEQMKLPGAKPYRNQG